MVQRIAYLHHSNLLSAVLNFQYQAKNSAKVFKYYVFIYPQKFKYMLILNIDRKTSSSTDKTLKIAP